MVFFPDIPLEVIIISKNLIVTFFLFTVKETTGAMRRAGEFTYKLKVGKDIHTTTQNLGFSKKRLITFTTKKKKLEMHK